MSESQQLLDGLKNVKTVNAQAPQCLFFVLLMLSFCLSLSNVSDEDKTNKALPIGSLIVYSLVLFLLLLNSCGVATASALLNNSSVQMTIFFVVLLLSLFSSIHNVSDKDQENKSFATVVLVVNSIIVLTLLVNVGISLKK